MTDRDLQRWSREVAEDPGAPSFVRLARAYRRQGRREAARDVVLGGLRANPEHVDGHALLALLHIEAGEREQARDEWETILRLDPGNFDSTRGLGFLALERGDLRSARRHLDAAAKVRPDDPAVRQAREVLSRRERTASASPEPAGRAPEAAPSHLFAALATEASFLGALLLDEQGLVLAGRVQQDERPSDFLGGLLSVVVSEARRTVEILRLGGWKAMLMETAGASLHTTALEHGPALVVVTTPDAPAGWVVRTARRARSLAERYLAEEL